MIGSIAAHGHDLVDLTASIRRKRSTSVDFRLTQDFH